ncbi:MAG TPA: PilT/PilU family type 4a pilus ATPase [Polyangiaceae bacterium]|nr:PilT/PilU family type 4a pilus ATPase [Polyangiaceae bacterium]
MKLLQQMLSELARPEVVEFAVVTERLPCVRVSNKYEPIDEAAQSTEAILELLVSVGGSRYVDDLMQKPVHWTARVEGGGLVEVHAVMREGRVQARFVPMRRAPSVGRPAEPGEPPPAAPISPVARSPRIGEPGPAAPPLDTTPHEGVSDPMLRAAMVVPMPARAGSNEPRGRSAPRGPARRAAHGDAVIDALISAREAAASDVHVVAARPVLLRIGGELVGSGEPLSAEEVERSVLRIVPERLRATFEEHGSCDFALEHKEEGRFRVNVVRQRTGLKACFRCIPNDIPTLTSLGLPAEIERATHHHQGLVLITGPTGHGKTSTLAAIVDIINRETTHHVVTVEDPVEFVHSRKRAMISQREIGTHTRSFASALKASLREDPDVIVVGELRDTETVRMALAASETGHLVIGTMNTPSAAKTIDRLVDLFPPADQQQVRMTLAGGLHLIVGQRLLPSLGGGGMVAAAELLPGSIALWSLIRDAKTFQIPSLQQRGKGFGIIRLDESLAELVRGERVTRDVAISYAENPAELEETLDGRRAAAPPIEPPKKADPGSLLGKAGQLFGKRGA